MAVPKLAHWFAQWESLTAGSITHAMLANSAVEEVNIKDAAVGPTKLDNANDYIMGTLEAAGKVVGLPVVTDIQTHTGIALADLTAEFGAPAGLDNGSLMVYTNSTDGKSYLVTVVGSVFHITAFLTAVSA